MASFKLTCFVVSAKWEFGQRDTVAVACRLIREEAEQFVQACRDHDNTQPPMDAAMPYKQWLKTFGAWQDAHPAGHENSKPDHWLITEVPFQ